MREILFHGKCNEVGKYNGQWIEGFYVEYDGKPFIALSTDHGLIGCFCEPDSIGQYTGLTDNNGKKIFDGDILEEIRGNEPYRDVVVANRWNCSCCDGVYGYAFEHHEERLDFRLIKDYTVVGNIYDNPELLEAAK